MPTYDSDAKKVFGQLDQLRSLLKRGPSLPVKIESHNGFSLSWFKTEGDAECYVEVIMKNYTGELRHGRKAERCAKSDYKDETHGQLFAVKVDGLK